MFPAQPQPAATTFAQPQREIDEYSGRYWYNGNIYKQKKTTSALPISPGS